jgi:hypothetical protein
MSKSTRPSQEDRSEPGAGVLESVWGSLSILTKPLKLERDDEGKVRVVVDDPAAARRKAAALAQAEQSLLRMRTELTELLDRSRGSRHVMPHLANLESGLKKHGLAAFDAVPERVLARASQQLEEVLTEPVGAGLADLRSRIVVAQTKLDRIEAAAKNAGPSSFLTDSRLTVSEGSVSDFMRAVADSENKA